MGKSSLVSETPVALLNVLFICIGNISRSQIAEAIYNKLSKEDIANSAGIKPRKAGILVKYEHNNPVVSMKEYGYDLSRAKVKKLSKSMVDRANKVVCILSKEFEKDLPRYLQNRVDLEFRNVDAISSETPLDAYLKMERTRIRNIERNVSELLKKTIE